MSKTRTRLARATCAAGLLLALTACSQTPTAVPDRTPEPAQTQGADVVAPAMSATPSSAPVDAAGELVTPDWAAPAVDAGTELATAQVGALSVRMTQAGTAAATRTGQFADPSGKALIEVGDELVVVGWVATNTSTEPVRLGYSLVSVEPRYDDWPYLQGMDSVVDGALFDTAGVHQDAFTYPAAGDFTTFVLAPGESISAATNFERQPGSPVTFAVSYVPVDEAGELLHEQKQQTTVQAVIS